MEFEFAANHHICCAANAFMLYFAQAILKAQKSKLNSAIQNLLDAGMSMDDIIHKLNG